MGQRLLHTVYSRRFVLGGAAATLMLSGCNTIPRGAPSRREVTRGASAEDADFALELVSRDRLPVYAGWGGPKEPHQSGWPQGGATPQDQIIAPGDRLEMRIWDPDESSLLTSTEERFADIANVTVSGAGEVTLPYVGNVAVGGLSAEAARARLEDRLISIVSSAQLQMQVSQGRRNSVDLLGGVGAPGTYPLTERNLPLSALISAAGGVRDGMANPQVQITRGSQVYRRPLEFVFHHPQNDPPLQGGDRVLIQADRRSFKALGAAGREEIVAFDADDVSALRAISLMGGMADTRADPRGILVLRRYPEQVSARADGPDHPRVVFSFDLTHASGLFVADEFLLADEDIVMATQAPATSVERVLSLMGASLGFGRQVGTL